MGPLRVLHLPVARPGPGDAARHEHSDEGEGRDQAPAHLDSECGVRVSFHREQLQVTEQVAVLISLFKDLECMHCITLS